MSSVPIVVGAAIVLFGFAALKGINPLDAIVRGIIWVLYQMAALMLAVARTADAAYFAMRREYRTSVSLIAEQRENFTRAEEARLATAEAHITTSEVRIQSTRSPAMLPQ